MAKVLGGYRVVDWTIGTLGPLCTSWLGSLGADVIHIEQPPATATSARRRGGQFARVPTVLKGGMLSLRESVNYCKKSIGIDLRKEEGKAIVYRMVERSDAFVTNQLPDTIEKLRLDYETLLKYNPKLVYGTATIMGPNGPDRLVPGYDRLGQARAGMMAISGVRGEPPEPAGQGIGDCTTGFALMSAVIAALLHRERTGEAQRVDTSQLQALMNIPVQPFLAGFMLLNEEQRRENPYYGEMREDPREDAWDPLSNYYRCKDGLYIQIIASAPKWFQNLCQVIDRPNLIGDPRFDPNLASREEIGKHTKELIPILDEAFAQKPLDEWLEKFRGVDCPFSPVNRLRDLPKDPQVLANDYLFTYEHPVLGLVQIPGMPFTMSKTPATVDLATAMLGEHTDEVLMELGYTAEEVVRLEAEKVVWGPSSSAATG